MKLTDTIKSHIMTDAISSIKKLKMDHQVNLHIHDEVLKAGATLRTAALEVPIDREAALVFVDLAPAFNWAHPCEYHLYDARTGARYMKVKASLPPSILNMDRNGSTVFHAPVKMIDTRLKRATWKKRIPPVFNALSTAPGERYAILFAGHANNRHTNDLEFLYRTLVDDYGFRTANIHILNHDGTLNYFGAPTPIGNWTGDNSAYRMAVTGAGTRAAWQSALTTIAGQIRPEDFLFIHTNNHGGGSCDPGITDYCMFEYEVH